MKPILTSLTLLVFVGGCVDSLPPIQDATVDHSSADLMAADGSQADLHRDARGKLDTTGKLDMLLGDGLLPDGTACVPEGGKFTDPEPAGRCCESLVPVTDAIPDGNGGCAQPDCPCYVCTQCGDATCGQGENYCNCPQDCPKPDCGNGTCDPGETPVNCPGDCAPPPTINAAITDEEWYQGGTTCEDASMKVTASKGTITVTLNQIPSSDVPGTCGGHTAAVTHTGTTLELSVDKTGSGACWTACWDFTVSLAPVAPGTYTVKYLSFSGTVTVL
ncbi:MAG: hypothetical protein JRH20_11380 [Deltaproteobacteria bacterium]|nr:hypothetical protein [Deltaproteobacteria bacterium]